jgi:hypothetical protein
MPALWKGHLVTDGLNPKDLIGAKKAPLTLVPAALVIAVADAMQNGAEKYGAFNWREPGKPIQVMTYVEAAQRHLAAYVDGEDLAPDSRVLHLGHAGACIAILLDATEGGFAVDNRPPAGPASKMLAERDRSAQPYSIAHGSQEVGHEETVNRDAEVPVITTAYEKEADCA